MKGWLKKDYALPFSSLPKYLVHLSLRASRWNAKLLFLHLPESNHKDCAVVLNVHHACASWEFGTAE